MLYMIWLLRPDSSYMSTRRHTWHTWAAHCRKGGPATAIGGLCANCFICAVKQVISETRRGAPPLVSQMSETNRCTKGGVRVRISTYEVYAYARVLCQYPAPALLACALHVAQSQPTDFRVPIPQ